MWLTGSDGNIWVWVMGDHPDDCSIDEILKEEAKANARRLAAEEVIVLKY